VEALSDFDPNELDLSFWFQTTVQSLMKFYSKLWPQERQTDRQMPSIFI